MAGRIPDSARNAIFFNRGCLGGRVEGEMGDVGVDCSDGRGLWEL